MAKKDMAALHHERQGHLNKAEDLTEEWFEYREAVNAYLKAADMGLRPTPDDKETAPDFYLQIAGNGLSHEQTFIRQIKRHRRKAARIDKKLMRMALTYSTDELVHQEPGNRGDTPLTSVMDEVGPWMQEQKK